MNDNEQVTIGTQVGMNLVTIYEGELQKLKLNPGDMLCDIVLKGKRDSSWTNIRSSLLRVGGLPGHLVADDSIELPDYLAKDNPTVGTFILALRWLLDDHYSQYVEQERERGHGYRFNVTICDRTDQAKSRLRGSEFIFDIENDKLIDLRLKYSPK